LSLASAAFVGHCFPVWLKFKGGKGVATFFGLLLRRLLAAGIADGRNVARDRDHVPHLVARGPGGCCDHADRLRWLRAFPSKRPSQPRWRVLIFWLHRANIARLRAGTEPRIGDKKKAKKGRRRRGASITDRVPRLS
jgi:glycerol-3-phosphate acyltransferase PlsY